ncbi:hypothetical protein ACVI1J_000144 [Bradyrhizobium diazoefficiens]|jgi:type IV secretion system protein TrbH|uniref:conjugal transfer protein TrbH n=1 Tax=Bradyrhizobium TaxID=374 RepID=UPI0004B4DD10|nr:MULTISPECIES: conjugal transfer protein TrbH [Bradyrhizobium]WLB05122.1 conjugal transfer protein TrbH [Bradyrhizobium elkanii]
MASHFFTSCRRARAAAFLLTAALLSGCTTFGTDGLVASTAPAELSAPAASAVAGDLVPRLAEQIGQGKATIVLKPDGSAFGSALETSLRGWGYAVTTDQETKDPNAIRLAYVLASMDGQMLARLSTGSIEIGRVYSATATGAAPASPVSVMKRG